MPLSTWTVVKIYKLAIIPLCKNVKCNFAFFMICSKIQSTWIVAFFLWEYLVCSLFCGWARLLINNWFSECIYFFWPIFFQPKTGNINRGLFSLARVTTAFRSVSSSKPNIVSGMLQRFFLRFVRSLHLPRQSSWPWPWYARRQCWMCQ